MDRMPGTRSPAGFTLVELLAVMLIVSLLLTLGVPTMSTLLHATQIRQEASRLLDAVKLARSEAVQRNLPVSLCPAGSSATTVPVAIACSGNYAGGWMVFANRDRDASFDPGRDQLIRRFQRLPRHYTVTNRAGDRDLTELITYLPDGSSRRNMTLMVCAPPGTGLDSRSVVLNRVGRPRLARAWGICPRG